MQVYLCDGPKKGHVIEVPSFQPIQFIYHCDDVGLRRDNAVRKPDFEVMNYTIRTFGEELTVDEETCWAFPDWKFVTWSLADLEWARFMCWQSVCGVVERRSVEIGSIGQPTARDACRAMNAIKPAKEYAKVYDQPPRGFVWPVEYHQPQRRN